MDQTADAGERNCLVQGLVAARLKIGSLRIMNDGQLSASATVVTSMRSSNSITGTLGTPTSQPAQSVMEF